MAMSTVAIHIFGDVPSSPLVGVLQVILLQTVTCSAIANTFKFLVFWWKLGLLHTCCLSL